MTEHTEAYGLTRPGLPDARRALTRVFGSGADTLWTELLASAGLSGDEDDPASLSRLLAVMETADPVIATCGRAMTIRRVAYEKLSAAHLTIRRAR
jgi:hypothetical protein